MRKEKFILFLVAIIIGLVVAGVAFYIYQSAKTIPDTKIRKVAILKPTPTPKSSIFLTVTNPTNEQVLDKKIITISGKTVPNAKIVAISPIDQESGQSSADGDFSFSLNIDTDQNILRITATAPNGETATVSKVVTYSTESF